MRTRTSMDSGRASRGAGARVVGMGVACALVLQMLAPLATHAGAPVATDVVAPASLVSAAEPPVRNARGMRVGIVFTQAAAGTVDYLSGAPLNQYYTSRVNQVKELLDSEGFTTEYVNDAALTSVETLKGFDVLVFTMTLATTTAQRTAILQYAAEGGGIVGSFGLSHWDAKPVYPQGYLPFLGMHGAPGVYTWPPNSNALKVWEWGRISEIFNVRFRNDPLMYGPYDLEAASTHWILTEGFSADESRKLTDKTTRYNAVNYTLPGVNNVTPLFTYNTLANGNRADDAETGHLAAWTTQYYFGRFAYFGFYMHDLINESFMADARTAGVARRVLVNSVRWAGTRAEYTHLRKAVELTGDAWYTRGTLYIDETARNVGATSLRGPLRVELRNPAGGLVYKGQAYDNNCPLPPGESYTHKSYTVPIAAPQSGTWHIRMTYEYFDHFRNGRVTAERTLSIESDGSAMWGARQGPQTLLGAANRPVVGSRIAGASRYETGVMLSRHGWPDGVSHSKTVILATGTGYADALAAAPLAGQLDAPVLLVPRARLAPEVATELTRLFAGRTSGTLLVVGGEGAVPTAVVREARNILTAAGVASVTIERLEGADRYGTARAIAERVGTPQAGTFAHTAFVVSGRNYPDALAISGLAAAEGVPLLPVRGTAVPEDIVAALDSLGVKHVTIVGGPDVVSPSVEAWLESKGHRVGGVRDGIADVDTRIAGGSRYETALAAGKYAVELGRFAVDDIYFATGRNWPDALALSSVAGKQQRTVVLIHGAEIGGSSAVADYLMSRRNDAPESTFIGGAAAISDYVRGQVRIALGM